MVCRLVANFLAIAETLMPVARSLRTLCFCSSLIVGNKPSEGISGLWSAAGSRFRREVVISRPGSRNQARNADDGDSSFDVVGERGQAERPSNVCQSAHQKRSLIHPLFDGAERVLDTLTPPVEHLGSSGEPRRHTVEYGFILKPDDPPIGFSSAGRA